MRFSGHLLLGSHLKWSYLKNYMLYDKCKPRFEIYMKFSSRICYFSIFDFLEKYFGGYPPKINSQLSDHHFILNSQLSTKVTYNTYIFKSKQDLYKRYSEMKSTINSALERCIFSKYLKSGFSSVVPP
jgi:hypothetical protein